ncbi:portal protein [Kiloniella sp. b19]|uniref:portal protein n=1 Tax=Kiloniella sp. GXU_MW_B19 TaxID=3141326 RepID=UPI0031CDFB72
MALHSDVLNRYQELKSIREPFLAIWKEVAARMDPFGEVLRGENDSKQIRVGDQSRVFSSRPVQSRGRFAAAAQSLVTPAQTRWHGLMPIDEALQDNHEVKAYAQEMTKILFKLRYHPMSGWTRANYRIWDSLGTYGTQCFMLEENLQRTPAGEELPPFRYRYVPMAEICLSVDDWGTYDAAYRRHAMSLRNLAREYGPEALPATLRARLDQPQSLEERFWVIHAVDPSLKGVNTKMPYPSVHLLEGYNHVLRESGYYEFPYFPSAFNPIANSAYGYGPAMAALPDVKMLNVMVQTTKVAAEQVVRPAFATTEKLTHRLKLTAGAINPDLIDKDGRLKIQPLVTGANPSLGESLIDKTEAQIGSTFYEDLWQILVNKPNVTAYEAAQRAQEKGDLIGPPFSPQEEMMARCVRREVSILERQARDGIIALPPKPAILEGRELTLDWLSPMARLRRSGEVVGINQVLQLGAQIEAFSPGVMSRTIDGDEILRTVHELSGAPQKTIRSRQEVEERLQAEEEQAARVRQQQEQTVQLQQAGEAASLMSTLQEQQQQQAQQNRQGGV